MKESLESVVPAAPPLAIGLRSSAPSSGDSLDSSPSDSPDLTPSDSSSGSSSDDNFVPLAPKSSTFESSACTLPSNSTLDSNCLPLLVAMEKLTERPEIKRVRKSEVRFASDLIIRDSLTDISEECTSAEERPPE